MSDADTGDGATGDVLRTALAALDQLRNAQDMAAKAGDEYAAGLLMWAIRDLAETIDLIGDDSHADE